MGGSGLEMVCPFVSAFDRRPDHLAFGGNLGRKRWITQRNRPFREHKGTGLLGSLDCAEGQTSWEGAGIDKRTDLLKGRWLAVQIGHQSYSWMVLDAA